MANGLNIIAIRVENKPTIITLMINGADNIDFDASAILASGARVADLGDGLYDYAIEVASGTRTTSEVLDVRETAISRFERSL